MDWFKIAGPILLIITIAASALAFKHIAKMPLKAALVISMTIIVSVLVMLIINR